jgi:hypothetical protein
MIVSDDLDAQEIVCEYSGIFIIYVILPETRPATLTSGYWATDKSLVNLEMAESKQARWPARREV